MPVYSLCTGCAQGCDMLVNAQCTLPKCTVDHIDRKAKQWASALG